MPTYHVCNGGSHRIGHWDDYIWLWAVEQFAPKEDRLFLLNVNVFDPRTLAQAVNIFASSPLLPPEVAANICNALKHPDEHQWKDLVCGNLAAEKRRIDENRDSCFISYSSNDEYFVQCLHADLQKKGVRCWFSTEDIKGGRKLHEQIGEAIRLHERMLLVLSEHSMNSEWVRTEIAMARKREVRETCQVIFPIRLVNFEIIQQWECFDADTGKDSAREIREYFIPDFSNWKNPDEYQKAFDRLLRGLKPES